MGGALDVSTARVLACLLAAGLVTSCQVVAGIEDVRVADSDAGDGAASDGIPADADADAGADAPNAGYRFVEDVEALDYSGAKVPNLSTPPLAKPLALGDLLVVAVASDLGTVVTVSDSAGDAFSSITTVDDSDHHTSLATFYGVTSHTSTNLTVTASFGASTPYVAIYAGHYAGLAPSPLEASAGAHQYGSTPSLSATPTSQPSLVWGFGFDDSAGQASFGVSASGVARGGGAGSWQTGGMYAARAQDRRAFATSPQTLGWTADAPSFLGVIAIFAEAP